MGDVLASEVHHGMNGVCGSPSVMLLQAKNSTATAAVSKIVAMNEPSIRADVPYSNVSCFVVNHHDSAEWQQQTYWNMCSLCK